MIQFTIELHHFYHHMISKNRVLIYISYYIYIEKDKYQFSLNYNIIIDMIFGQLILLLIYYYKSSITNNIIVLFKLFITYYNQFNREILNNKKFGNYNHILKLINIVISIHKWYYKSLLFILPFIKYMLFYLMIFGLSIPLQIIIDWIFLFFPSIFIIRKVYTLLYKLFV